MDDLDIEFGEWQFWDDNEPENFLNSAAFVYLIEFETGEFYIGQKRIWKGIKDSKRIRDDSVQSNWKSYSSSSTEVKARIESGEKYQKFILACFDSYAEALHCETCLISFLCASELFLNKALIVKTRLSNAIRSNNQMKRVGTILDELRGRV